MYLTGARIRGGLPRVAGADHTGQSEPRQDCPLALPRAASGASIRAPARAKKRRSLPICERGRRGGEARQRRRRKASSKQTATVHAARKGKGGWVPDSQPGTRPCGLKRKHIEVQHGPPHDQYIDSSTCIIEPYHGELANRQPAAKSAEDLLKARRRRALVAQDLEKERSFQDCWRESRRSLPAPTPPPVPAKDRLEAIRRRVLLRSQQVSG